MIKKIRQNKSLNFYFLIIGQFISILGTKTSLVVFLSIVGILFGGENSAFYSTLVFILILFPTILFSFFFGALADRIRKKKLMLIADILSAIVIIFIFISREFHSILLQKISLLIGVSLIGIFVSMFEPAKKALIPFIVEEEKIKSKNKLYAVLEIIAMLIGLLIGGVLVEKFGIENTLLFDFTTYLISFGLISLIFYKDNSDENNENNENDENIKDNKNNKNNKKSIESKREYIKNKNREFKNQLKKYFVDLKIGYNYIKTNINLKSIFFNLIFIGYLGNGFFLATANDLATRYASKLSLEIGASISYNYLVLGFGALFATLVLRFVKDYKESQITKLVFIIGSIFQMTIFLISKFLIDKYFLISYLTIVSFYFFLGIAFGIMYIRVLYLIHTNSVKKHMGKVLGLSEFIIAIAIILGMLIGGFVNNYLTFVWGFFFSGIISIIGLISFSFFKNITW